MMGEADFTWQEGGAPVLAADSSLWVANERAYHHGNVGQPRRQGAAAAQGRKDKIVRDVAIAAATRRDTPCLLGSPRAFSRRFATGGPI